MGRNLPARGKLRKVPSGRPVYLIASAVVNQGPLPLPSATIFASSGASRSATREAMSSTRRFQSGSG